jgi:cytochrome c oxidase subunit IV
MTATAAGTAAAGSLRNTLAGFVAGAAFFSAIVGYLIGATVGAMAGALIGAFIGVGGVLLAWQPRPHDAVARIEHDHPNYMVIWLLLFVLMLTKVVVAFLAFSKAAIIVILVAIAIWKAVLVALYYMHLKFEPRRMWLLAASPAPLIVILLFVLLY